jgi:hypothetical protein
MACLPYRASVIRADAWMVPVRNGLPNFANSDWSATENSSGLTHVLLADT